MTRTMSDAKALNEIADLIFEFDRPPEYLTAIGRLVATTGRADPADRTTPNVTPPADWQPVTIETTSALLRPTYMMVRDDGMTVEYFMADGKRMVEVSDADQSMLARVEFRRPLAQPDGDLHLPADKTYREASHKWWAARGALYAAALNAARQVWPEWSPKR